MHRFTNRHFQDPGQFFDPLNIFSLSEVPDGTQYGTDFL